MNDNEIQISVSRELLELPIRVEWAKYVNERVTPGEVILLIYDNNDDLIKKIKSTCHGKVRKCYTSRKCTIVSEDIGDENNVKYVGYDEDFERDVICNDGGSEFQSDSNNCNTKLGTRKDYPLKLELIGGFCEKKANDKSIKGKLCFGYYSCDHTTFVSEICVECGYILGNDLKQDSNKHSRLHNTKAIGLDDYITTNSNVSNCNKNKIMNAGFISNEVDIKFSKDYVNEQEKLFIYELLYVKKKLSLVLDLDNTLIHATSSLPDLRSNNKLTFKDELNNSKTRELVLHELYIDIKTIMSCELNEDTYNKYFGSVVLMERRANKNELLPKGLSNLPHYDDTNSSNSNNNSEKQTRDLYFRLLESLIFCIPYSNDSNWSCGYYKLRPGVLNMLKTLSESKYEIYMYTMGTEYHAYMSLRMLDPEIRFFNRKRIFYRNNGFIDSNVKSMSTLFPHEHRSLIIIDDIEQAWSDINSLLKVYPYNFFPSENISSDPSNFSRYISALRTNNKWNRYLNKKRFRQESDKETVDDELYATKNIKSGDSNEEDDCTDLAFYFRRIFQVIKEIIADEKDKQLTVFQKLLESIHEAYFNEFNYCIKKFKDESMSDQNNKSIVEDVYICAPNVSNIIKAMRRNVLLDLKIQFSGFRNKFLYNFKDTDLYKWCRYFGSRVVDDYIDTDSKSVLQENKPDYCICEQLYTQKYYNAVENNIPCLTILWLETIIYAWIKPEFTNTSSPFYKDPVFSELHSPFEVIEFDENGDFISSYRHTDLYSRENLKATSDLMWQEALDDISFSIENEEGTSDDSRSNSESESVRLSHYSD